MITTVCYLCKKKGDGWTLFVDVNLIPLREGDLMLGICKACESVQRYQTTVSVN